ncbi:MAG: sodium:proton antiporter NhaD [Syntrophaceae bacterium]|nr:sodium:proton antiporter NhaD [Syntrophaceae bacterium]
MEFSILIVFLIGYLLIAFEHPLKIDKAGSALLTGVICWTLYALSDGAAHTNEDLMRHLAEIAGILFFLLGAMTIVELVDAHDGFAVIIEKVRTRNKVKLLWLISMVTFFLSAVLDNLTTSIVMISLLKKIVQDRDTRWLYAGIVVISANAGGAWSPIGDVTTTMLWIKGQLPHSLDIIKHIIIPSMVCVAVPILFLSVELKGNIAPPWQQDVADYSTSICNAFERNLVFITGLTGLLFVPVFKTLTHLPPFMGMMFSLSIIWLTTEFIHRHKPLDEKGPLSVLAVLRKIDTASILFFLGILLAVSTLEEAGLLGMAASFFDKAFTGEYGIYIINMMIGLLSAVIDNVPLVAAAQGMYPVAAGSGPFAPGGLFWLFLAYCAGTGGSALIIGSAAGIAVMGLERMDFIWYLKKITLLSMAGYLSGAVVFVLMNSF